MSNVCQVEMLSLDQLVPSDHPYRRYLELVDFNKMCAPILELDNAGQSGANGYGIVVLFKCLMLQFIEDLSDRQLERYFRENVAAKFFCGFGFLDSTPEFSLFTRVRKRIGTHKLSLVFTRVREALQSRGLINEVFTFIDATHLISKSQLWEERDRAIQAGYDKLNNATLPKVSNDRDARIGCKGRNKFWYGYKQHVSVDMQSGLIGRVAITPANVSDAAGLKHVCPRSGAVYADKGYCVSPATEEIKRRGCHDGAIRKNNMKDKNHGRDKWISKVRGMYESVFSKRRRRTRYIGVVKNQFAGFMSTLAFNFKRLLVLRVEPLTL